MTNPDTALFREHIISYLAKCVLLAQSLPRSPTVDAIVQVELPFVFDAVRNAVGMPRIGQVCAFHPNPPAALRGMCARLEDNGQMEEAIRCVQALDVSDSIFQQITTTILNNDELTRKCVDAIRPLLRSILE